MIHGIKIARNAPSISHLIFADDTMLFCRANLEEVSVLDACLKKYKDWSVQRISKPKSGVLFSPNTPCALRKQILAKLEINLVTRGERYLGNPLIFSRNRRSDFHFLKEKVMKRLEGWKARFLSRAGRTTRITSVIQSIPLYTMSTFNVPISIYKNLDNVARRFWWTGGGNKNRFFAWKAWDTMCQPKSRGGIGLRRMADVNRALLSKMAWKLANNENRPWINLLHHKYYHTFDFWEVSAKPSDSLVWKGILSVKNMVLKDSCFLVRDGTTVDIWKHP